MSKFGSDRTNRTKMRNKILLVLISGYQKFFVPDFFLLTRSLPKIIKKYNLEWQKERVVNERFIFTTQKVLEFEIWILTPFSS